MTWAGAGAEIRDKGEARAEHKQFRLRSTALKCCLLFHESFVLQQPAKDESVPRDRRNYNLFDVRTEFNINFRFPIGRGTVSRDFYPLIFSDQTNPSGPLIDMLKYFPVWFQSAKIFESKVRIFEWHQTQRSFLHKRISPWNRNHMRNCFCIWIRILDE